MTEKVAVTGDMVFATLDKIINAKALVFITEGKRTVLLADAPPHKIVQFVKDRLHELMADDDENDG